jgi:hypothetical protein
MIASLPFLVSSLLITSAIGSTNDSLLERLSSKTGWSVERNEPSGWIPSRSINEESGFHALAVTGETTASAELIAEIINRANR